jgi:single stranded DNA-binding protein
MSYQQITILGNLTRDAEVRQVGQSQVAKIGVAVSDRFRKQDGTIGESTEFFDAEIWDKAAVYPYLVKGQQVLVIGQFKTEKWTDQNGQPRETRKIRVLNIQLCGGKPQAQPAAAPPAPGYAPQPAAPGYQAPPAPPQYQQPAPAPAPAYTPPAPPAAPAYQQPVPTAPAYAPNTGQPYPPQPGYAPNPAEGPDLPF